MGNRGGIAIVDLHDIAANPDGKVNVVQKVTGHVADLMFNRSTNRWATLSFTDTHSHFTSGPLGPNLELKDATTHVAIPGHVYSGHLSEANGLYCVMLYPDLNDYTLTLIDGTTGSKLFQSGRLILNGHHSHGRWQRNKAVFLGESKQHLAFISDAQKRSTAIKILDIPTGNIIKRLRVSGTASHLVEVSGGAGFGAVVEKKFTTGDRNWTWVTADLSQSDKVRRAPSSRAFFEVIDPELGENGEALCLRTRDGSDYKTFYTQRGPSQSIVCRFPDSGIGSTVHWDTCTNSHEFVVYYKRTKTLCVASIGSERRVSRHTLDFNDKAGSNIEIYFAGKNNRYVILANLNVWRSTFNDLGLNIRELSVFDRDYPDG